MQLPEGVEVLGPIHERYEEVLSVEALEFLADLQRRFAADRGDLLAARARRQTELDAGSPLEFLPETESVRQDPDWRVAEPAPGLVDRRVEITGPTDRKMTINALNSGAKVWLADFEDANAPLWENQVGGQLNLMDALDRRIDFRDEKGKEYALRPADELATIVVRPRGWHLPEKHLLVDGEPISASLFDFGLYFFHCARRQLDRGAGPYFYLPKLQHHLEARLWNEVFVRAQELVGIPRGTIRATVLIETIPAAFCMEEILYELREHSAGLNAGRWDYLFSVIKTFRTRGRDFVLPERNTVTMTAPFMRAYTELLVSTCHRRGAHAIGGMAAFIPSRRDPAVNEQALAKVRQDKRREAGDGFDGSWVAHPDLVPICREEFDAVLGDRPNQLDRLRDDVSVSAAELLDVAATPGEITEAGLRNNISVGLQYLAAWLGGNGAVAIYNLMEDAATAEISRSQVWQWVHNDIRLADGRTVTGHLVNDLIEEELAAIADAAGESFDAAGFAQAAALFRQVALAEHYEEFLTLPAYDQLR
ncbi:malate synthase A [Natronosporangium hydrolyticum]|uniref:Malate synthase n=1 Tax=Natronosporangium hydrolyticum TaxID=2811111 RepID=A0A895Y9U5_9ACTN|nr:malate synthase A [Natronosporangium hydrolyticum]QSB13032.1 malate synthase A [Natronosporangium hydrolyticum]